MRWRKNCIIIAALFFSNCIWLGFCFGQVEKGYLCESDYEFKKNLLVKELEISQNEYDGVSDNDTKNENNNSLDSEDDILLEDKNGNIENEGTENINENEMGDEHTIRVLITKNHTSELYYDEIILRAGEEKLIINARSSYFEHSKVIRICLSDAVDEEMQGIIIEGEDKKGYCHSGILEVRNEAEGLILIEELPLEEYVRYVVPSEMPGSYPLEALKAQAICARTYAMKYLYQVAYTRWNANLDDSTNYQVYHTKEPTVESDLAVRETKGLVLLAENHTFYNMFYYSTSCGRYANEKVWHGEDASKASLNINYSNQEMTVINEEFDAYIKSKVTSHIEVEEPWYRWSYCMEDMNSKALLMRCIDRSQSSNILIQGYRLEKTNGKYEELPLNDDFYDNLGNIKGISIIQRIDNGVADCMLITCEKGKIYVWGEYNIRYILTVPGSKVDRQDGYSYTLGEILPSAFISLHAIYNEIGDMVGYNIFGGGFGHGVGMSQNGAKQMALAGNTYEEILATYFNNSKLSMNDE